MCKFFVCLLFFVLPSAAISTVAAERLLKSHYDFLCELTVSEDCNEEPTYEKVVRLLKHCSDKMSSLPMSVRSKLLGKGSELHASLRTSCTEDDVALLIQGAMQSHENFLSSDCRSSLKDFVFRLREVSL